MVSSDKELEGQLVDAGKKLLHPPSPIDDLLPLLDHVENCLSKVEQSPRKSMQDALSTLQKALVASEFIKHCEVDVKVAVASCISEITRISAPEAPYEDDVMKEVFQLIVSSFDNISDKSSRSFVKRVSILETASKVRSCVVMLDLECDSLIVEMFRHFFREIRDYHDENVFSSMETIMTLVIDESEEISPDLLCSVLDSVKKDEKDFPMAKKLGEKVLENCSKKLKPFLGLVLKSLGGNSDDYSVIVASICASTNGVVEQSNVQAVTNERSVSPQDDPTSGVSPNTMGTNGLTSRDKSLSVSNSSKKEEDGCENLTYKESVDANEGEQGDNDIAAEAELRPEQDSVRTENEPSSSAEASNRVTNTVITEEGSQKKEDQSLESSPDQKDTNELGLPAESRVEASVELNSSKTPQNESANTALPNQNDDVSHESKACENPSKEEDEVEEAEVPSNDPAENKTKEKEDLAGEIDDAKGRGGTTDSSGEEKTLTAEDSVKDTEATSDSAATKSNKSKTKVNVKPEKKKIMSGRMQEERGMIESQNKGNDALKSSKNSDKKEMVRPLKSSSKEKQRSGEASKGSLKRKDTPSKKEGGGGKRDGAGLVGSEIKVWWPMDKAFYKGRVVGFDAVTKKHRVLYFDGDVEVLFLRKERWEIIKDGSGDVEKAMEGESSDASLEVPPKKAKLMKSTHSATKQGKMVSTPKQGGGSSSGKLKVGAATSTGSHKPKDRSKADDRREDDAGGESSFRTPKSGHKSIDASSDKAGKSNDHDSGMSSKATNPKGNVSGPKSTSIKSKHGALESGGTSKSKQESNSKPTGKLSKSLGKSRNKEDSGKAKSVPAKSEDSSEEATDEDEADDPGKKRKPSGSSSSKGKVGKLGDGKKRRRGT